MDIFDDSTNLGPDFGPTQSPVVNEINTISGQIDNKNVNNTQEMQEVKVNNGNLSGLFKFILLIIIPLALTVGVGLYIQAQAQEGNYKQAKGVLLSIPMKNVNWADLGNVFEPVISLPIKTQTGYEEWEFLLDSGAVVSSLPRDWADKMGKDLAFMKRSTFRGFGGKTSFAYQGEMMVNLGDEDVEIPVVYTEAAGTKSLLGRKGFFEDYSIYFNHKEKTIEIRN